MATLPGASSYSEPAVSNFSRGMVVTYIHVDQFAGQKDLERHGDTSVVDLVDRKKCQNLQLAVPGPGKRKNKL